MLPRQLKNFVRARKCQNDIKNFSNDFQIFVVTEEVPMKNSLRDSSIEKCVV